MGVDAHAFEEGVKLVLGGVEFDSPRGLAGHSDGDVIAQALIDALLSAAHLCDIRELFPSSDPTLEGASSVVLLGRVAALVGAEGGEVAHGNCVFVREEPKSGA